MFETFISIWEELTAAAPSKVSHGLSVHGCLRVDTKLEPWKALLWCSGGMEEAMEEAGSGC